MKKYIILICIIVALVVAGFIGYFVYKGINSMDTDVVTLKSKADKEMAYLDNTIISMMNRFNNISYANYKIVESEVKSSNQENGEGSSSGSASGSEGQSGNSGSSQGGNSQSQSQESEKGASDETMTISNIEPNGILINDDGKIDWDTIKNEVENIYSNWPTMLVDLNSLNVNKDNLIKFSDTLNQVVSALDDENRGDALLKLSDLYGLMNSYIGEYSNDSTMINIFATKSYVARAYALIEQDDRWDDVKQNISNARVQYNNVMNGSFNDGNMNNINRGYILLAEMEKNVDSKNKKVFLINYKNLMEELDVIDN